MTGHATLVEWNLGANGAAGSAVDKGVNLKVDFDPQSLELSYTATGQPSAQTKGSGSLWNKAPEQQTGQVSSLSLTLVFDDAETGDSVQRKTDELVKLTLPSKTQSGSGPPNRRVVRFSWGSFLFVGSVQSMTQTIDFFSADGVPLRASAHLTLQEVGVPLPDRPPAGAGPGGAGAGAGIGASASFGANVGIGASLSVGASASLGFGVGAAVGTTPLTLSQAGDTVQGIIGRAGASVSWQAVAAANNIDNPRLLPPGSVLDLSAGAQFNASAGIG